MEHLRRVGLAEDVVGEFMEQLFGEQGFQVVGHEIYPTGNTDFAPGLLKSRTARAQLIFIWMDMPESAILRDGGLPAGSVARWLGLLPSLLRPEVRDLLVVGLGGGMALEPVPSSVEAIDVIELFAN